MGAGDWYREKIDAQTEFDIGRITREVYEMRTKFAIGMIYKCGSTNDKEVAERMAKAHGYDLNDLVDAVL